jgi:hypothetical protein
MRFAVFLAAGLAVITGVLRAQSDDEEEMDYFPLVPSGSHLRFGLRFVSGPKITFGQLGIVPANIASTDATAVMSRDYNDGYVYPGSLTDANGNPANNGLTNTWNYNYGSQVTPGGNLAFHVYSTSSAGVGFQRKADSAAGWELQYGRVLGRIARKVDFSVVAGFSFASINAKKSGTISAQLNTLTDVYSLNGQTAPTAPYTAPTTSGESVYDANGNPVVDSDGTPVLKSIDTSVLLGALPTRTTVTGTADVKGHWQIKGAYYTFRIGPMFEVPITERLKLSLGAGAALAYVGSRYVVNEEILLDETTSALATSEERQHSVLLPTYYADADAEFWLTERTGFFLGASYQKSGSFDQTLGGRTAKIDLSTSYGFQSGITLRF